MIITDIDLYMKFQRQPRALGTICYYAPTNKLLIPDGIKRGDKVFVIDYTQSKDDVYVTVADMIFWGRYWSRDNIPDKTEFKAYVKSSISIGARIMVVWRDLAQ